MDKSNVKRLAVDFNFILLAEGPIILPPELVSERKIPLA